MPFISVCIPAYKNPGYLQRLLESISIQTFKDFEVIITDDSPDDSLQPVIDAHKNSFKLIYIKNVIVLGTPANWNFAISKANGMWIKLMHNDDWFTNKNSLEIFAGTALSDNSSDFIFSGFNKVKSDNDKRPYVISMAEKALLEKSPLNLFKKNFIGHPSTTLIKNSRTAWYDERIKWVVDFEFYIRCLRQTTFYSIDKPLINIGIHGDQVTRHVFRKPEIEIAESLYLVNKLGKASLKNMFVYDYYWRLFRNLEIRNFEQLTQYSGNNEIPGPLKKMLMFQFKISLSVLKIGMLSKSLMLISRYFNSFK